MLTDDLAARLARARIPYLAQRRAIRQAIANLPERQAEAMTIVYIEGASKSEAARRLCVSTVALHGLLTRAMPNVVAEIVTILNL